MRAPMMDVGDAGGENGMLGGGSMDGGGGDDPLRKNTEAVMIRYGSHPNKTDARRQIACKRREVVPDVSR